MEALKLVASHCYCRRVGTEQRVNLDSELRSRLPRPPRRLTPFIRLAMVGALDCLAGQVPAAETGVLIITHKTNADAAEAMIGKALDAPPVLPLPFIHSSPQMAGFYLAQALGLRGPNVAVAATANALQQALQLMALNPRPWLVGQVEEVDADLATHRQRRQLDQDIAVAEVSAWAWFDPEATAPLTTVTHSEALPATLAEWITRCGQG